MRGKLSAHLDAALNAREESSLEEALDLDASERALVRFAGDGRLAVGGGPRVLGRALRG